MGRPQVVDGPPEKIIDVMAERGAWIIGTPDDCIEGIKRLEERSGGFGAFMCRPWTGPPVSTCCTATSSSPAT